MSEPSLVTRLERVEQENRRWKAIGLGVLTLMGLALLMGAANPGVQDEVRARRFTLVDDKGKVQGFLGFSAIGSPTLFLLDNPTVTLFDSERRPRVQLAAGVVKSGLRLYEENGNPLADLYVEGGDWPRLSLYDKAQRRRVALEVLPDGSPDLTLRDEERKVIWKAP